MTRPRAIVLRGASLCCLVLLRLLRARPAGHPVPPRDAPSEGVCPPSVHRRGCHRGWQQDCHGTANEADARVGRVDGAPVQSLQTSSDSPRRTAVPCAPGGRMVDQYPWRLSMWCQKSRSDTCRTRSRCPLSVVVPRAQAWASTSPTGTAQQCLAGGQECGRPGQVGHSAVDALAAAAAASSRAQAEGSRRRADSAVSRSVPLSSPPTTARLCRPTAVRHSTSRCPTAGPRR
ncbi:hypothetical protein QFZ32_004170 [Streptomyces canus]|nr:hypothetical protein [Streptomyces canus]